MCVGEIISLPWFSKELKNDLSKNNCLHGVILILLVRESIFVGWGSPFSIVLDTIQERSNSDFDVKCATI